MRRRFSVLLTLAALAIFLGSEGQQALAEKARVPAENPAVSANNAFAFDLYARLAKESPNKALFFSPWSISNALSIVAEGARKQTADEMGKTLRFPNTLHRAGNEDSPWDLDLIHKGTAALNKRFEAASKPASRTLLDKLASLRKELDTANNAVRTRRDRDAAKKAQQLADEINKLQAQITPYELRIANALWAEKTYPFQQSFLDRIAKYHGGAAFPVDFRNAPEKEREKINAWVEKQTRERIKNLIPKKAIDEYTRLVVTNAIYFKGEWTRPFAVKETKDRPFTLADGKEIKVPMMHAAGLGVARYAAFEKDGTFFDTPMRSERDAKESTLYPDQDGFEMLELPYKGDELAMLVLLPRSAKGLPALEKLLTSTSLQNQVARLRQRRVHVFLPKLRLETSFDLNKPLRTLGMKRAFTDPRRKDGAQFDGMSQSKDPMRKLYITKVLHKAFVDVNEKGTEAAAATAVIMARPTSAPARRPFIPTFEAKRPFVFLIRDKQTGCVLFLGRVLNPKSKG